MAAKEQTGVSGTQSEYGRAQDGKGRTKPRILSAVQARQGVVSGRVATVLGVSITLVLLGLVLAFVLA